MKEKLTLAAKNSPERIRLRKSVIGNMRSKVLKTNRFLECEDFRQGTVIKSSIDDF